MTVATKLDRASVVAEANPILASFNRYVQFELYNNTLWLASEHYRKPVKTRPSCGDIGGMNYGASGMGGTQQLVVGQLVRWIRGETRLPLKSWEYWTGPSVGLGSPTPGKTYDLVAASSYPDPDKTKCVICGKHEIPSLDWWSSPDGKVVGPCCTFGTCETEEQKRIRLAWDRKQDTGRATA